MTLLTEEGSALRSVLQQKNAASLHLGSLLAAVLLPLFWILDLYVLPERLWFTLAMRLSLVAFGLACVLAYRINKTVVAANVIWLAPLFEILIATSISVMCWLHTGYASEYYAGINLTIITAGFLFTWNLRQSLLSHGLVYAIYIAPLLFGILPIEGIGTFLNNQFFLIGTIVIIVASQEYRFRLEARQFADESELRSAKATVEDALGKLKEVDRKKSEFFNSITHELRTPLTVILAPLEGLLEEDIGGLTKKQKEYLEPIWQSALKLLKMINDLLDLAKLGEGFLRLRIEQSAMADLLQVVVEHSKPLAERKEIVVTLDVPKKRTVNDLYLDTEKMERAVTNIVSNALKFTPQGGRVDITLDATPDEVLVSIEDTGIGIPEDKLHSIFERFSQVDGATTRRFGGTGIGLALAREMVELHGGRIEVESEIDVGTKFVVHLRRGDGHLDDKILDRRAARRTVSKQRRIEDHEPREWTRALMEREDFRFLDIEEVTERRLGRRLRGR